MNFLEVHHDAEARRFGAEQDGLPLALDYEREGDHLIITHTGVAPALRGRGLAALLVEHALAWAAPLGLRLVPACSYVARHLQRHPHWLRLTEAAPVQAVLNFWFGPLGSPEDGQARREWFAKDPAFDAEIAERFGPQVEMALSGQLGDWQATPLGSLARILLLDQFTRNIFRGRARAFAGDGQALAAALQLVDSGAHLQLSSTLRVFAYLPLEHAENLALQWRCVALFEALSAEDPRQAGGLDYARRHLAVIEHFGRFPHRNAALARASTPEELAYLAAPGAGF